MCFGRASPTFAPARSSASRCSPPARFCSPCCARCRGVASRRFWYRAPLRRLIRKQGMDVRFSAIEARVIGCLMEKQVLTPDQYPLSLNALTNACNQKSSRDPVLTLDVGAVQHAVNGLVAAKHVMVQNFGSRVDKYQQRFCNTQFAAIQFTPAEFAVICLL